MYGYAIFVTYPFAADGERLYAFSTDEKRAEEDFQHCKNYAEGDGQGIVYRMVRAELTELPDDIDADNERTIDRIKTADEIHAGPDYPFLTEETVYAYLVDVKRAEYDYLDHAPLT